MAQRRMFSADIVASDAFLDMPTSSQLLYFQLGMFADDDGFVNPKKIMRMVGASNDDIKILITKRFLLAFETGVVVIKHWLIHNLIRHDRYKETMYVEEKKTLQIKDNKSYTELATNGIPNGNQMAPQVRLGKDRLGKDNNTETSSVEKKPTFTIIGAEVLKLFEGINPACKKMYSNKTQRSACDFLIETYGFERVKTIIEKTLPKTNGMDYFPRITTPLKLQDKWVDLEVAVKSYQSKKTAEVEKRGHVYI